MRLRSCVFFAMLYYNISRDWQVDFLVILCYNSYVRFMAYPHYYSAPSGVRCFIACVRIGTNSFWRKQNMKNKRFQRVLCFILSVTMLLSVFGVTVFASEAKKYNPNDANPYTPTTAEEMQALIGTLTYVEYLDSYSEQRAEYVESLKTQTYNKVAFDILNPQAGSSAIKVSDSDACAESKVKNPDAWTDFTDEDWANSIYLPASGKATWQVTLGDNTDAKPGLYYIKIEYYSVKTGESTIASIERKLKIDDAIPFKEVSTLKFDKNWAYKYGEIPDVVTDAPNEPDSYNVSYELRDKDGEQGYYKIVTEVKAGKKTVKTYRIMQDINGNSMSPESSATSSWNTYYVKDSSGYYDGAFEFYFETGTRTITLEAEREPMIIKSIELVPVEEPVTLVTGADGKVSVKQASLPTYAEIVEQYKAEGKYHVATNGQIIELQAEFPDLISDSSVSATNDNTSAVNSPVAHNSQIYNVIGENSYRTVGQWAAYKFKVTESGLYNLAM